MGYINHSFGPFLTGFKRNPFRVIGTLMLLSVLFFVTFLLIMFSSLTEQSITKAENKVDLVFFLEKQTPETKKLLLQAELEKMKRNKQIQDYTYKSEAEALQQFAEKYPQKFSFLRRNTPDTNPMTASFTVTPGNSSLSEVSNYFSSDIFIGIIDLNNNAEKTLELKERNARILNYLHFIEQGIKLLIGVILICIGGVTASFISSSFLLRQKEIFIMRLVGASYGFIRSPFLVEGVLSTTISLIIGWEVFLLFRNYALTQMFGIFSSTSEMDFMKVLVQDMWLNFQEKLPYVIAIILFSSLLISFISIERLLLKKRILQS